MFTYVQRRMEKDDCIAACVLRGGQGEAVSLPGWIKENYVPERGLPD